MTKLFSPSLKLRREPPNSKAKVMHVGTGAALVNFRGRSLTARVLDPDIAAGEDVSIIECPRNVFHIRRTGPSWYALPLEAWAKAGKKACVALEYFLRKCKKYNPYRLLDDGTLIGKDPIFDDAGFGTQAGFDSLDTNGDGFIDAGEWAAAGGDAGTFADLDTDGDGQLSPDEYKRGAFRNGDQGSMGGEPMAVAGGGDIDFGDATLGDSSEVPAFTDYFGTDWEGLTDEESVIFVFSYPWILPYFGVSVMIYTKTAQIAEPQVNLTSYSAICGGGAETAHSFSNYTASHTGPSGYYSGRFPNTTFSVGQGPYSDGKDQCRITPSGSELEINMGVRLTTQTLDGVIDSNWHEIGYLEGLFAGNSLWVWHKGKKYKVMLPLIVDTALHETINEMVLITYPFAHWVPRIQKSELLRGTVTLTLPA